jgi:arsenate reductase (glutaredoxin)
MAQPPSVTIYHNPNCSSSKKALAAASELGVDVQVVQYVKAPPDRATLEAIVAKLEGPVADLVRKDALFDRLGLDPGDYTEPAAVVDLLVDQPALLQRPLLVTADRAVIGRPTERAEELLSSIRR